jgi:hypothetical protein
VDPIPDPLLLRKSGSAGNRTLTSVSVARNSDQKATEAVETVLSNCSYKQELQLLYKHKH